MMHARLSQVKQGCKDTSLAHARTNRANQRVLYHGKHGAFRQLHLCHADNEADERQVDNILESKVSKVIAGSLGALLVYYAQVPQGLAMEEMVSTPTSNPSVDLVSAGNVGDVINEIESAELPLLQEKMGALENSEATQAAEKELQALEQEAATIAEEEDKGMPSDELARETGGLLDQINSFKAIMRSLQ